MDHNGPANSHQRPQRRTELGPRKSRAVLWHRAIELGATGDPAKQEVFATSGGISLEGLGFRV